MEKMLEADERRLSFGDLRVHYYTGRSDSRLVGRYKVHTYTNYAKTNIGELELPKWRELAMRLISDLNEEELQRCLFEWVSEHDCCRKNQTALLQEILELHVERIFDDPNWVGFISFNQKYRPEVLDQTPLVYIETVCCKKSGLSTASQVNSAASRDGRICCPFCGRFSEFRVVE